MSTTYDDFLRRYEYRADVVKATPGWRLPPEGGLDEVRELRFLIALDVARVRRLFASGERVWLGPRHLRVRIDMPGR